MRHLHDGTDGWMGFLAFVAAGILGGIGATVVVAVAVPDGSTIADATLLSPIMAVTAIAGGVLAGWFVATLLLSRTRGKIHCPRCGTVNERGQPACRACGF